MGTMPVQSDQEIPEPTPAKPLPRPSTAGKRPVRPLERIVEGIIFFCGITSILFVALIFLFIFKEAFPLLLRYPWGEFFLGKEWTPVPPSGVQPDFGLLPLLISSILITLGAIALAVPLGITSAIFIAEIAPAKTRDFLKSTVELLAALPSVVLGFFAAVVLSPFLQKSMELPTGDTMLTGAITLAFMAIPTIATISEDAINAVPRDVREGSLGLGASHWQTIWRVQVPAAFSGIIAAVMLGIGRAIGETMVVLMVTGNNIGLHLNDLLTQPGVEVADKWNVDPQNPIAVMVGSFQHVFGAYTEICRTITATIAAEMGELTPGELHYHALFMLGVVLFLITFSINLTADFALRRAGGRE
ncbi:MAG: phosphate ABC transporter permease subunit PstC [Armatimonadaceae bacterium]